MTYDDLERVSDAVGEFNDCTVKALAVVTEKPYILCKNVLEVCGRNYQEGVNINIQCQALKILGAKSELIETPGATVLTVVRELKRRGGKYLIYTDGHVTGFNETTVIDWVKEDSRKRVDRVVKVD